MIKKNIENVIEGIDEGEYGKIGKKCTKNRKINIEGKSTKNKE